MKRRSTYEQPQADSAPDALSDENRRQPAGVEPPADGTRAERATSRLRWPLIAILTVLAAVALAAGANELWRYLTSFESTDDAQIEGYIDPISSRINGTAIRVAVEDNQHAKVGEILVQLDPSDYQVAVEQARANLAQAEAEVNVARQGYAAAQAQLREAQAADVRAQHDAQRYRALLDQKVASQAQYDQYVATANVSAATVEAQRAAAAGAQRMIASKQADVLASRSALDQALLNLSYTNIKAPADGIVGKRTVQLGQRVEPGQQLLALTQTDRVWVTANFKETQLAMIRPGQPVTIYVDAFGHSFRGRVESLPGASGDKYSLLPPENATGNYVKIVQRLPVRIIFDTGQPGIERLRPGMSVEPTVWIR
ncbi:MAG TPA: HlyD family secretion protein [Candidatus Binataceae bacterium]|nr:HlyD family secretion protein [Candidatus Binataceae bacterium]